MTRYTINYEETYSGTFTVELNDDSTEQDAINELLDNADEYVLDAFKRNGWIVVAPKNWN